VPLSLGTMLCTMLIAGPAQHSPTNTYRHTFTDRQTDTHTHTHIHTHTHTHTHTHKYIHITLPKKNIRAQLREGDKFFLEKKCHLAQKEN
jgi:hypothetical protein